MSRMKKTLSSQAADWREGRRLRAFELKEQGWKQRDIARALGITEGAVVSQWMKRAKEEGGAEEGLRRKPPPGAPPRLGEGQRAKLLRELLAQGAESFGFRGEVWTCARVTEIIRKEFGVSYHPAHVSRLVRALGLSLCKKSRRAGRTSGTRKRSGTGKRSAGRTSKRGPEGGQDDRVRGRIGLLPFAGGGAHLRSGRPDARPPRAPESRDHLSAISAITPEGKLYMHEQDGSLKGPDVIRFLKHLLRRIAGKLLVIWDGSPIHRSRAVKEFLEGGAAARLRLERLPGYAPELNPDEGVWKHLKYVELKNVCCRSLSELRRELRKAKERLRHKRHVILGCVRQPGFYV
jgi:transposase